MYYVDCKPLLREAWIYYIKFIFKVGSSDRYNIESWTLCLLSLRGICCAYTLYGMCSVIIILSDTGVKTSYLFSYPTYVLIFYSFILFYSFEFLFLSELLKY
jgi:hypothetical protein